MAALLMLPLTILAGGAADFAYYVNMRSELQSALDAAVLAGARAQNSESVALANFRAPLSRVWRSPSPIFLRGRMERSWGWWRLIPRQPSCQPCESVT
jgi:hypothetical protein